MSQDSVRERLDRMRSQTAGRAPSSPHSTAPYSKPTLSLERAKTRREKLDKALYLMAQGGVKGRSAYPPLFDAFAQIGLVFKPLQFWSIWALFIYGFVIGWAGVFALSFFCLVTGIMPRAFAHLLQTGIGGVLVFILLLSAFSVALVRRQAHRCQLPRWEDL